MIHHHNKMKIHFIGMNGLCRACKKTKEEIIAESDTIPFIPETVEEFNLAVKRSIVKENENKLKNKVDVDFEII